MGKLVVVNFVSMDGVLQSVLSPDEDREGGFEHGGWVLPYVDEVVERFMRESTTGASGLLLGRKTYEIFVASWSQASKEDPAVAAMNRIPKYVASRTLRTADWHNSTILGPDLSGEVERLVAAAESEIVLFGSGELLQALERYDLVDEYRLLVFPLLLGNGKRLTYGGTAPAGLTLTDTVRSTTGVLINTYQRADRP